jgi:hypothetical protein
MSPVAELLPACETCGAPVSGFALTYANRVGAYRCCGTYCARADAPLMAALRALGQSRPETPLDSTKLPEPYRAHTCQLLGDVMRLLQAELRKLHDMEVRHVSRDAEQIELLILRVHAARAAMARAGASPAERPTPSSG